MFLAYLEGMVQSRLERAGGLDINWIIILELNPTLPSLILNDNWNLIMANIIHSANQETSNFGMDLLFCLKFCFRQTDTCNSNKLVLKLYFLKS